MVQAKKQQINIEIQSFLTVFTWFLFIPIFYTAAENLVRPSLFYFIRFCAIIELSYVLMAVCLVFTVKYQSEKNHRLKSQSKEISN